MGRGKHCRQVSLACVGSACSVWATLGLPPFMACVRSLSALLRLRVSLQGNCLKWALGCVPISGLSCSGSGARVPHKGTDSIGAAFCALTGSEQLGECTLSRWAVRLITSLVPAARISGCAAGVLSQMCHVSPLGSWSLAATLLPDVNRPGSQEELVSNWGPAHSLVEDAVSGAKITPCLPALAVTCLPCCLRQGVDHSTAG